jgi:hypothetical protein
MRTFTTENWHVAPHNRKSFQHVQSLFPTTRIRKGEASISDLPARHRDLGDISYDGLDGAPRTIARMLDDTYTDAFLVMKDGVVITEHYANGMSADSHHLLNSVSKSFVGMLAGILVEDGVLDPAQNVAAYIPELKNTAFEDTTLQHALDMTAAVKYTEDYAVDDDDIWIETAVVGWRPHLVRDGSAKTLLDYAASLTEKEQKDGAAFHYRTVLTSVIARAIERAAETPVQDLLKDRLWRKLGPEQDAVIVVDRTGFPYFGAGMNACARDLARFGQMLLQDGEFNGAQIVPAQWVQETRNGDDNSRRLFAASDYSAMMPDGHYRNQVWAANHGAVLYCIGIHGQTIYINRDANIVAVKLSVFPEPGDDLLFGDTFLAMTALGATL